MKYSLPALTLALPLLAGVAQAQSWSTYSPKPNEWFNYTASVAEQGGENQIFVFGGSTETTIEKGVYRYHRLSFWSPPLEDMPSGRRYATSATGLDPLLDERVYVFGGESNSSAETDNTWAYDPVEDEWETGLAPMLTPRRKACAVNGDDGWIYVFGGFAGSSALKTVERYSPMADQWESLPDMAFPRYSFGAALACDGFIYLFGGETGSGQTAVVECFKPGSGFQANNENTTTPCADMLDVRSDMGCATGRNGRIYLVGGSISSPVGTASVQSYDPWTNTWDYEPDLPTSRNALCAVGLGSRVWALGGYRKIWPTTAKLEGLGSLPLNGACSDIVPSVPYSPWGGFSACSAAGKHLNDGSIWDVGIDGGTPGWVEFELAEGQRLELLMKNGVGDDTARMLLWDKCGGQVLTGSNGTGIPGEQVLEYQNDLGVPTSVLVELTWPGAAGFYLEFDLDVRRSFDSIGTTYCSPAVPNSSGLPASIGASGDTLVGDNDFALEAWDLPPHQFGYFLASQTQAFIQQPGGSQGNLCLGGKIARFVGDVANSGPDGTIGLAVDLFELPTSPQSAVQPGETWNFQAWYRDKNPGTTSNFTDAVSVSFQ